MSTVREYYEIDFETSFRFETDVAHHISGSTSNFVVSVLVQLTETAKLLAYYFPKYISDANIILESVRKYQYFLDKGSRIHIGPNIPIGSEGIFHPKDNGVLEMTYRLPGETAVIKGEEIPFTGRIFIYTEGIMPDDVRAVIGEQGRKYGLRLVFRDAAYAAERDAKEQPRAFISHDSRDKEEIARPIASKMRTMGCPVWYDEFSLEVGQSLRESIEHGLKVSRMCIFVLTPNFLSKGGWPKREYDAIFTRELVEQRKLILPIWSKVAQAEVYEYSPVLADRVALIWEDLGEKEVCRRLFNRLKR